jgi:hypothetical protein
MTKMMDRATAVGAIHTALKESDVCDALVNEVGIHPDWVNAFVDGIDALACPSATGGRLTRRRLESYALAEHLSKVGKVLEVTELTGHVGDAIVEFSTTNDNPFMVRVQRTADRDVFHWTDRTHLDPYWDVELERAHPNVPQEATERSLWIFGPAHDLEATYSSIDAATVLVPHVKTMIGPGTPAVGGQEQILAQEFHRQIRSALTARELDLVDETNARARAEGLDVCATHDFCDANEYMAAALQKLGVEFDLEDDATHRLINAAWDLAKKHGFSKEWS